MSHTQSLVPEPSPWGVVSVVGVGLIGGSLAAGLRRRGLAREVIGVGRDASRLEAAVERGLLDTTTSDLAAAAARSDLMIFCTPVDRIAAGICEAAPHCRPGTLLSDAGSVKLAICRAVEGALPAGVEFLGGHPMAGGESQGYLAADPELFVGRRCVLTDCGLAGEPAQARLAALWRGLGARVLHLSPEEHDRL
ncbi:MAG: prephenate dehydrogenase, partial [Planctomycetaceae bacterium]